MLFKSVCNGFVRCIDCRKNGSNICSDTAEVKKENAMNMLTLYIRLPSFPYAKDNVQAHKIQATEMKKSSKQNQ